MDMADGYREERWPILVSGLALGARADGARSGLKPWRV
jgi:hypothetical protein